MSNSSALAVSPSVHNKYVAVNVPNFKIKRKNGIGFQYLDPDHRQLPHVIKFSGGRSSGLMLLMLLNKKMLKAHRGDVVMFTNTSAEHPATYDFVKKMKKFTEEHGIPFFITELQTYETVVNGMWMRRQGYRLVNENPLSKSNPNGYRYKGEIFEEMVAEKGMLPSRHTRVCTVEMKMKVTREFLSDWFSCRKTIPFLGHKAKKNYCVPKQLYYRHLRNGGKMSQKAVKDRYKFLKKCPTFRPEQKFADYTKALIREKPNKFHMGSIYGEKASILGDDAVTFLTFLGFRRGEEQRYMRMIKRNNGEITPGHDTHPPGEYSYAPLFDFDIDQNKVKEFWNKQPAKIRPYLSEEINLSNCVFCFQKGVERLDKLVRKKKQFEKTLPKRLQKMCNEKNTPNSINWWINMEKKYSREANTKDSEGKAQQFGMFGMGAITYQEIKLIKKSNIKFQDSEDLGESLTCDCSD